MMREVARIVNVLALISSIVYKFTQVILQFRIAKFRARASLFVPVAIIMLLLTIPAVTDQQSIKTLIPELIAFSRHQTTRNTSTEKYLKIRG